MARIEIKESLAAQMRESIRVWPNKVSHMIPEGKSFREITFTEFGVRVFEAARALDALGATKGDRVAIIGETAFDWAVVDWACQSLGVVSVPIYPTLPADQTQYIIDDADCRFAICSSDKMVEKVQRVPAYLWSGPDSYLERRTESTLDQAGWNATIDSIASTDLATLIYTSGTTGNPKGVMLNHRNFLFLNENIQRSLPVDENDLFLSWLPISHVFERYAGHVLPVSIGATIAYCSSVTTIGADMQTVRPTIFLAVPRFLESMRSKILDNVAKQSPVKRRIFRLAASQNLRKARGGFAPLASVLDKIAMEKVRARTGGRIRYLVSGGAALPKHVSDFFLALGFTILQGYGLTETTAATSLNRPDDNRPHTVGPPVENVEIKIAADGEILQRGPSVMMGYYNLPNETREAIDDEGWFHTGDIGELEGKHIKITDRKKDLLVLGNGKNVAPQPIENALKESLFISEALLLGDGMEHCAALIVPDFERISSWLADQGITEKEPGAIATRPDVQTLIRGEVEATNKRLADFERVRRHVIVPKAFSIDDGELTPSMKVRRKVVKEKYRDLVEGLQRKN